MRRVVSRKENFIQPELVSNENVNTTSPPLPDEGTLLPLPFPLSRNEAWARLEFALTVPSIVDVSKISHAIDFGQH